MQAWLASQALCRQPALPHSSGRVFLGAAAFPLPTMVARARPPGVSGPVHISWLVVAELSNDVEQAGHSGPPSPHTSSSPGKELGAALGDGTSLWVSRGLEYSPP